MTAAIRKEFEKFMLKHQLSSTASSYAAIEEDFINLVERISTPVDNLVLVEKGRINRFLIDEFNANPVQRSKDLAERSKSVCSKRVLWNAIYKLVDDGIIERAGWGKYQLVKEIKDDGIVGTDMDAGAAAALRGEEDQASELDSGLLPRPEGGALPQL